jgi:hypothetical protein
VPKTPISGAGLERNQVPLSAEITCRVRPKSGAGLLRFLHPEGEIALAAGAHPDDAGIHGFGSCIFIKDGWYELSRMGNYGPSTRDGRTATTHRSSRGTAKPPMDFGTRDLRSSDIRD